MIKNCNHLYSVNWRSLKYVLTASCCCVFLCIVSINKIITIATIKSAKA